MSPSVLSRVRVHHCEAVFIILSLSLPSLAHLYHCYLSLLFGVQGAATTQAAERIDRRTNAGSHGLQKNRNSGSLSAYTNTILYYTTILLYYQVFVLHLRDVMRKSHVKKYRNTGHLKNERTVSRSKFFLFFSVEIKYTVRAISIIFFYKLF